MLLRRKWGWLVLAACVLPLPARAVPPVVIPDSADAAHIRPEDRKPVFDHGADMAAPIPEAAIANDVPEQAKTIDLILNGIQIEGLTVFDAKEFEALYHDKIGHNVKLAFAWEVASAITKRYQDAGYFLSRAFVPPQTVKEGIIHIQVIEGYIGHIDVEGPYEPNAIVQHYIDRILAERPVTSQNVESMLLRMNDLPGLSFRAVLSLLKDADEGAVNMTLVASKQDSRGSLSFDNYGSRYLGPNEAATSYNTSFLPMHNTTISGLSSLPKKELKHANIEHKVAIYPDLTLDLQGHTVHALPGYHLENLMIDSKTYGFGVGLHYQLIRQRQENLAVKLSYESDNTRSDISNSPLTRDHTRVLDFNLAYDLSDQWDGTSIFNLDIVRGIDGLGASKERDLYISREHAHPDFTKGEMSLSRNQRVADNWSLLGVVRGQYTTMPMYSSEEFGYGGSVFGRAYDTYELSGDQGVNAMVELRYGGISDFSPVGMMPYVFYDIGKVWNLDEGQTKKASGASAGFGTRLFSSWDMSANLALAWPLTRDIATPIYGGNPGSPRILVQISQGF